MLVSNRVYIFNALNLNLVINYMQTLTCGIRTDAKGGPFLLAPFVPDLVWREIVIVSIKKAAVVFTHDENEPNRNNSLRVQYGSKIATVTKLTDKIFKNIVLEGTDPWNVAMLHPTWKLHCKFWPPNARESRFCPYTKKWSRYLHGSTRYWNHIEFDHYIHLKALVRFIKSWDVILN
jgi:hypothetical protein